MRLFIAEKPSVAKAIAEQLGITARKPGVIECGADRVTWCVGHMLEQAEPDAYTPADVPLGANGKKVWRVEDLPIIPTEWQLNPKPDTKEQLAIIGRLLKDAKTVVHAGDADREGQLLVDEVLRLFGNRAPVLRFWVKAIDRVSVQRGLSALFDSADKAGFGLAAQNRARADWLIGMNLSRAFTLRARRGGSQALLTVGRVQTPTLALVVARDREIEGHKPVPYHTISAQIEHANGAFRADWRPREGQAGFDAEGRLTDTAVANGVVSAVTAQPGAVTQYEQQPGTEAHPRSFSLSRLTLMVSNRFGYTAEEVLKICQALYETHKLTSYPRSDCEYLPESQHADAPAVLAALRKVNPQLAAQIDKTDPSIKSATWNDKKVTAHHGIVPTMHDGSADELTPAERNVYGLIVRAYLAQFYPLHEYQGTKIAVEVAGETFAATGRVVTRAGWKELYVDEQPDDEDAPVADTQSLPAMGVGDAIRCAGATRKDSKTKAPSRFTEGSLGIAMQEIYKHVPNPEHRKVLRESDGIGTEATRPSIISELRRRSYTENKGKFVHSTTLGRSLVDVLPEIVKSPVLAAINERMLKDIEQGGGDPAAFALRQEQLVRDQVAKANDGSVKVVGAAGSAPCPKCSKDMRRIKGPHGFFWSCMDREACGNTMDDKAGKPIARETAHVSELHKCMECGKGLVARTSAKKSWEKAPRRWWGCSGFPDCKQSYYDKDGKPDYSSNRAAT